MAKTTADVKPWEKVAAGTEIVNKSLGRGVVKAIDGKYIFVAFHDRKRLLLYP